MRDVLLLCSSSLLHYSSGKGGNMKYIRTLLIINIFVLIIFNNINAIALLILPGTFSKTGPSNRSTNQSKKPTFSWTSSSGAYAYYLCIDTVDNNKCDTGGWTGRWMYWSDTSYSSFTAMKPGTTYYWQVRAQNSKGTTYADGGAWWSFTTAESAGILEVTPIDNLTSLGNQGGSFTPSSKDFKVKNTGDASINWTVSKTQTWVSLSSTGGTLSPDESTTVSVSINNSANSLSSGTYNDTITFTNTTNWNGNTTRTINLTVNEVTSPLTITTTSLTSGTVGISYSESLAATEGTTPYSWSITSGALPSGLSLNTSGTISGTPSLAGTYDFMVQVRDSSTPQKTATKNLSIVITRSPGAILQVLATDIFVSSGMQGGPFIPSSMAYTLTNTGSSSLDWTASKTQSWIDISVTSGTLMPGANTTITASLNGNADNLTSGIYYDTVTFTNTTNGTGNTTEDVTLYIDTLH